MENKFSSVYEKIMALVIQHAPRWKVIDFGVPNGLIHWISNAMPNQGLDLLEHVKVDISSRADDIYPDSVLSLQASPRRLTLGKARLR